MIAPRSIAEKESRTRYIWDGKTRLARSNRKLKKKRPIGKWTSIGWSGCRSGLPSRKSFTMSILLRRKIRAPGLGDFAPFIFRHSCDADAVGVSHHSAQISGAD